MRLRAEACGDLEFMSSVDRNAEPDRDAHHEP